MRKLRIALVVLTAAAVLLVGASLATQMLVPGDAPLRFPKDGQRATFAAEVDVANVNDGKGVVSLLIPVQIDEQLVHELVPVVVTPGTWVKVSGAPVFVPARFLPTRDSQVLALAQYLTDGRTLRVVVQREGSKLRVLKAEPCSLAAAKASALKVGSIGAVDFDRSVELTGVVNGWDGVGDQVRVEFNTPVSQEGFALWLRLGARISPDASISIDGKPVDLKSETAADLGFDTSEILRKVLENQVVALFEPRGSQVWIARAQGTREQYFGPYPGDTGALEEELDGYPPADDTERLHAGDGYLMMNGLEFTVPTGWEGTCTVPPGDSESPEYILLHAPGRTEGRTSVMLYSAGTVPLELHGPKEDFTTVLEGENLRVLMGKQDFPKPPMRLFVAQTSIPTRRAGAVYFGGSSEDPLGSVRAVWQLFRLRGVAPEPKP